MFFFRNERAYIWLMGLHRLNTVMQTLVKCRLQIHLATWFTQNAVEISRRRFLFLSQFTVPVIILNDNLPLATGKQTLTNILCS